MILWSLSQASWIHYARSRLPLDWSWWLHYRRISSKWLTEEPHYITALRQHPYPTTPPDPDIFESVLPDTQEQSTLSSFPTTSNEKLFDFVLHRNFRGAERVRHELQEIGYVIPPHPIYELPARHALKSRSYSDDALTAFTNWFSLIPPASVGNREMYAFHTIQYFLYRARKVTDARLIMGFAQIAASKGYTSPAIYKRAVPFVVRFTEPSVSLSFLAVVFRHFSRADWNVHHNAAVRAYCLAGRIRIAFRLFKEGLDRGLHISLRTYRLLHHFMYQTKHHSSLEFLLAHGAVFGDALTPERLQPLTLAPIPTSDAPRSGSLVDVLRFIKHTMLTQNPPRLSIIVDFISRYKAAGRVRALELLLRKASRTKRPSLMPTFLLAEMLYYYRKQEYHLLLVAFAKHFVPAGVPFARVLDHWDSINGETKNTWIVRMIWRTAAREQLQRKLYPTHHHTALVWHALARLEGGNKKKLDALYTELVREACGSTAPPPPPTSSSPQQQQQQTGQPLLPKRPPLQLIDAAHFTPFVELFASRSGYKGRNIALLVMHHMRTLGIPACEPDAYHTTALLGQLASRGVVRFVMYTLRSFEEEEKAAAAAASRHHGAVDLGNDDEFLPLRLSQRAPKPLRGMSVLDAMPAPTFVTYAAVISGFVKSGQPLAAFEARDLMLRRADYVRGINLLADLVVDDLEAQYPEMVEAGGQR